MISAGAMRHQVSIQQRSTTQDAAGEAANTWTEYALRRAAIDRTPGSEAFAASERSGRVPTVFRLRYLSGVVPSMRIVFNGKVYNIVSAIDQSGRGEELLISAEEVVEAAP